MPNHPGHIIDSFHGYYRFLSNFYPSRIHFHGHYWATAEHAFQASKALDTIAHIKIRDAESPGVAKYLGRRVKLRPDWEEIKLDVMLEVLRAKFNRTYHPILVKQLLNTNPATLIEGNHWRDTYWGVCNGEGENHLGILLMQVRKELAK